MSMNLTENDIKEFQRLYKNRFGKEIRKEDAYEQGIKLIRLMQIICKDLTIEKVQATRLKIEEIVPKVIAELTLHERDNDL